MVAPFHIGGFFKGLRQLESEAWISWPNGIRENYEWVVWLEEWYMWD